MPQHTDSTPEVAAWTQLPENCLLHIAQQIQDAKSLRSFLASSKATWQLHGPGLLQHHLLHHTHGKTTITALQALLANTPCSRTTVLQCVHTLLPRLGVATSKWCMVVAWASIWVVTHRDLDLLSMLLLLHPPASGWQHPSTARHTASSPGRGAATASESVHFKSAAATSQQQTALLCLVLTGCAAPLPASSPAIAEAEAATPGCLHGTAAATGAAYARLVLGLVQQAARCCDRHTASAVLQLLLSHCCLGHRGEVNPMAWATASLRALSMNDLEAVTEHARAARMAQTASIQEFLATHPDTTSEPLLDPPLSLAIEMEAVRTRLLRLVGPAGLEPHGTTWVSSPAHPRPYWCWSLHDAASPTGSTPAAPGGHPAASAYALSWLSAGYLAQSRPAAAKPDVTEDLWVSPLTPAGPWDVYRQESGMGAVHKQLTHRNSLGGGQPGQQGEGGTVPPGAGAAAVSTCTRSQAAAVVPADQTHAAVASEPACGPDSGSPEAERKSSSTSTRDCSTHDSRVDRGWRVQVADRCHRRGSWDGLVVGRSRDSLAPREVWCLNQTPAYIAAHHGQVDMVRVLLTDGASQVNSAVEGAASGGQCWLLRELTRGDGPYQACIYTWAHQALIQASAHGRVQALHWLITHSEVEPPQEMLYQLCLHAVRAGQLDVVQYMVRYHGVTPSVWEPQATMLQLGCWTGREQVVRALVSELGAKDLQETKTFLRALVLAAHAGHTHVVQTLLDLSPQHLPHITPALQVALKQQHLACSTALVTRLSQHLAQLAHHHSGAEDAHGPSSSCTLGATTTPTPAGAVAQIDLCTSKLNERVQHTAAHLARTLAVSGLTGELQTWPQAALLSCTVHYTCLWGCLAPLLCPGSQARTLQAPVGDPGQYHCTGLGAGVTHGLCLALHALSPAMQVQACAHKAQSGDESAQESASLEIGEQPDAREESLWASLHHHLSGLPAWPKPAAAAAQPQQGGKHTSGVHHGSDQDQVPVDPTQHAVVQGQRNQPETAQGLGVVHGGGLEAAEGTWIEYKSANRGFGEATYQVLARRRPVADSAAPRDAGLALAGLQKQKVVWRVEFSMMDVQEASRAFISDTVEEANVLVPAGLWDRVDKSQYRRR